MKRFLPLLCVGVFIAATAFRYGVLNDCTSLTLDKMNVFYIGVDNPVTIKTPGVPSDKVQVVVSGGGATITKTGGSNHYIVRLAGGGTEASITVNYKNGTKTEPLGQFKCRVKRVPDPVCYAGNIKGDGQMTKAEAMNIYGVFAKMENFDFDLKFDVVSFCMTTLVDGKYQTNKASGPGVTAEMTTQLKNLKSGDRLLFEKVTVKGPDGTVRKIPGVIITVK